MRIGFFTDTYTPQINGVVTSIQLFAKALERQGHSVYIFAPTPRQTADGPHIVRIPSLPFAFQPEMRVASIYSQHAYTLVRRANLDIIHSHDPFAVGLFGLAMAKRFRVPYVHTYHTLYPEYVHYVWETRFTRAMAERLSRDFCDQCDLVLAPSTKIERALHEWGVTSRVERLATGVDADRFRVRDPAAEAELRRRFAIPESDRLLVFVGRLGKEKSVDTLVDAMQHVRTPGARLLLVGDGPHREELTEHIAAHGLADRVTFTGYLQREDVAAAYGTSEALFFASTSETQGLVIAEAMAAGLPVVAVDDLAIADAVTDGSNGFLVSGGPTALAQAADRVLGDADLHTRMCEAARSRANDLRIDNQAALLVGFYDELLASRPSPRRGSLLHLPGSDRVERQLSALRRGSRRMIRRYL
jgi:1,2-diacylglycerol 3-alpha-glucosyltransferase